MRDLCSEKPNDPQDKPAGFAYTFRGVQREEAPQPSDLKESTVRIVLTSIDEKLAAAWKAHCGDLPQVEIHLGNILELQVDAVVSPANSFGFMDGGIDLAYSMHFGWKVQQHLQALIRSFHRGELLVGQAEIVPTDDAAIPYVIAAPTMRVPMILRESVNPYLAARAALLLIKEGDFKTGPLAGTLIADQVRSVAIPGLGTGVGRTSADVCARQVRIAIEEVLNNQNEFPRTWKEAQVRHQALYTDDVRDLQY